MYTGEKQFLFSFDVETDGLFGEALAFGISIWDLKNEDLILETGATIKNYNKIKNIWVAENIVPILIKEKYRQETSRFLYFEYPIEIRSYFWSIYTNYFKRSIILADFQFPCETNFLYNCIYTDSFSDEKQLSNRIKFSPYPLIDLGTMFACANFDPDIDRIKFIDEHDLQLTRHNPIDDSILAAKAYFKLVKIMNNQSDNKFN